jgi:radical SAM-linked protein
MVRERVRLRFAKQGDLRFLGHRDLMRAFERLCRRARLPLGFSEGFHPRPRMSFPLPLALGMAGTDEIVEIELSEAVAVDDLRERLADRAPPGLEIRSAERLGEGRPKARVRHVRYEAPLPEGVLPGLPERIERLLAARAWAVFRSGRRGSIDLRPLVEELALEGDRLTMRLRIDPSGSVSAREVAAELGLPELEHQGIHFTRTAVEIER